MNNLNMKPLSNKELEQINGGGEYWEYLGDKLGDLIVGMRKTMDSITDASRDMIEANNGLPTTWSK